MRRKSLRVLVLMHDSLVPPDDVSGLNEAEMLEIRTEYDVVRAIAALGHEVHKLGVSDELAPLRQAIQDGRPDVVFNLLEEFQGQAVHDHNVVGFLELMRAPYSGCNPRGLVLARDKALSKKILHYHRIRIPAFAVVPVGRRLRRPRSLDFPLIVKSLVEEASLGISRASVVHNDEKLAERVRFIHDKLGTDCIVEQYIPGRELYIGVIGNRRLTVLPPWELIMENPPDSGPFIATRKVKWDPDYQAKREVFIDRAQDLSAELLRHADNVSKRIYRLLDLTGYARIDFRLNPAGELYFLEANPNPDIARDAEFASSADAAGIPYEDLLDRLLRLGLRRGAH